MVNPVELPSQRKTTAQWRRESGFEGAYFLTMQWVGMKKGLQLDMHRNLCIPCMAPWLSSNKAICQACYPWHPLSRSQGLHYPSSSC